MLDVAEVLDADELERRWQASPVADDGTIHLFVVRTGGERHETPDRLTLSPEQGVIGDRWTTSDKRELDAQVTLMERRVAALVTGGGDRLHLPGDNVIVDLDLSKAALPVGTRLRLGTALIEVTALPHAGCDKFRARVGDEALRWVNAHDHRPRRLRGVNTRIVEGGVVTIADRITRVG
jgi:hypothetical protein